MLGRNAKKLIIVCDKKTEQYANYLRQLISTNDDKEGEVVGTADGSVEVAVWLEKDYVANKAQISSNEHILFIGEGKESRKEVPSMVVKYNKYGMKYGWLGKRAMLQTDDAALSSDNYSEFIEYALGYQKDFDLIVLDQQETEETEQPETESEDEAAAERTSIVTIESQKTGVAKVLKKVKDYASYGFVGAKIKDIVQFRKKAKDQQYRALSVIFYIDGLKKFLEG